MQDVRRTARKGSSKLRTSGGKLLQDRFGNANHMQSVKHTAANTSIVQRSPAPERELSAVQITEQP